MHAGIGPGALVLYDVPTLYFETDEAGDFRKPRFSKERGLEPQITVGLLPDASRLPLSVGAYEGNMAETRTMLPMIRRFQDAYGLDDVTIVADVGVFSRSNKDRIVTAGLGYIIGTRFKDVPYVIQNWRRNNPDEVYEDQQIWTGANRAGNGAGGLAHDVSYYQYSGSSGFRVG